MNDLSNTPRRTGGRRSWIWVLAPAALLLIGWRVLHKPADAAVSKSGAAIAVDTATVAHADMPIYLSGLEIGRASCRERV